MTAPIEDVSSLPGKKISDQAETPIGEVKEIYATDDGYPMWVAVELSSGIADKRTVFVPLARIKEEHGELRVPYSKQRLGEAPEVDPSDGISAECDRQLRDYYGIDAGDQELRADNKSYAARVVDEVAEAKAVDNPDELETPDADTRTDETRERLHDPGSSEMRQVSAEDVAHDTQGSDEEDSDSDRKADDDDRETDDDDRKTDDDDRKTDDDDRETDDDGETDDHRDREAGDAHSDREAGEDEDDHADRETGEDEDDHAETDEEDE